MEIFIQYKLTNISIMSHLSHITFLFLDLKHLDLMLGIIRRIADHTQHTIHSLVVGEAVLVYLLRLSTM